MKQEDKEILIKDLCARLPYGVKVLYNGTIKEIQYIEPAYNEIKLLDDFSNYTVGICEVKPYLRPMSSMTKEEEKEYRKTMDKYISNSDDFSKYTEYSWTIDTFDFLNAHHLDYRGLIPMGLALEASKDMYKL